MGHNTYDAVSNITYRYLILKKCYFFMKEIFNFNYGKLAHNHTGIQRLLQSIIGFCKSQSVYIKIERRWFISFVKVTFGAMPMLECVDNKKQQYLQ